MNCDRFHTHLEDLLCERLDRQLQDALLAHADACEECGTVLTLCQSRERLEDPSFVESVVGQTTGAVCSAVVEEMGEWLDGRLERTRAREFSAHVSACAQCGELAAAMRRCDELLPELAEMPVDANFTADVLMATLASASLWHVAWRRMVDFTQGALRRPAFPLEASFVATALLVILTATPMAPWPQLPARALAAVQTIGEESADLDPARATWAGLADSRVATAVERRLDELQQGWATRWRVWGPQLDRVGADLESLGRAAIQLDFDAWLPAAQNLGRDVKALGSGPEDGPASDPRRSSTDE